VSSPSNRSGIIVAMERTASEVLSRPLVEGRNGTAPGAP
jgi:hypothetical protein